jgi:hypothetical protein
MRTASLPDMQSTMALLEANVGRISERIVKLENEVR